VGRRYLDKREVESAIRRGRDVEIFLGHCERDGQDGVRWIAISSGDHDVVARIYETADYGDLEHCDLYSFGPLNPELELDEADETLSFSDVEDCLAGLDQRFSGASGRIVNQFMVQDEYYDYKLASGAGGITTRCSRRRSSSRGELLS
jgi:hypothetical protein